MGSFFDVRTLSCVTGLVSITLCVIMGYLYRSGKTYPGFFLWTLGSVIGGVGALLLSMRGSLADFVTIVVANTFVVIFYLFIFWGLALFWNRKPAFTTVSFLMLIFVASFIYFTYQSPSIEARIVIICLYVIYFNIMSSKEILKVDSLLRPNFLISILFFIIAWNLFRMFFTLNGHWGMKDFMAAGSVHSMAFIVAILSQILTVFGLILANQQRIEIDLKTANNELKTLSGTIPICSYCKGIRDDAGEWSRLEKYIETHSEAQFSHGICDKCLKERFPNYAVK